jgi:carbon monoxide dehydrogenase subunit G
MSTQGVTSPLQGQSELLIHALPERIWEILDDPEENLPEILPIVKACVLEDGGREELGAVRTCTVEFRGKPGTTTERCVEFVPNRQVAHRIEQDTLGMSRLFSDYSFRYLLRPNGDHTTLVRLETHFQPRGIPGRLAGALVAKRQSRKVRGSALENLKRLAEAHTATI